MPKKLNTARIASDHEREVASDLKDCGCTEGEGRVKRRHYGESAPDVLRGWLMPDGQLVMIVGECKARKEGYPSFLVGAHEQNAGYCKDIQGIPLNAVFVTNRPGRGGKSAKFVSMPYGEFLDFMRMHLELVGEVKKSARNPCPKCGHERDK